MASMIFISTMAIIIAIVGCAVIWKLDADRADEIDHPVAPVQGRHALDAPTTTTPPPPSLPSH